MSSFRNALVFGAALSTLLLGAQARAATASAAISGGPSQSMTGPGFATAEVSTSSAFVQANSYEFNKGLGISGFSAGNGTASVTTFARASAAFADSFRVNDTSGLGELADAIFLMNIGIRADGSASSSNAALPSNPAFFSQAGASYDYSYSIGGVTGAGHVQNDKLFRGGAIDIRDDAPLVVSLFVRQGDLIDLNFGASLLAGVFTLPGAPASATADFDHTLAWDGVIGLSAMDTGGNAIALPDGFRLSLISDTTGLDYWTPAGPNPFTSGAVPEPATWAMMLLGFGGLGVVLRRRRAGPATPAMRLAIRPMRAASASA